MNRHWPDAAAWALLVATALAALVDMVHGGGRPFVAATGLGTGLACLSIRRHFQHSLMATGVMLAVLSITLFPAVPLREWWPTPLLASALLIGSRAVVQALARRLAQPGLVVLIGGSLVFGLVLLARSWWQHEDQWLGADGLGWLRWGGIVAMSALAQFAAAPWLVKTIPEAKQDERPAIALWLVLLVWMIVSPAH
jgi:hypothetical protein